MKNRQDDNREGDEILKHSRFIRPPSSPQPLPLSAGRSPEATPPPVLHDDAVESDTSGVVRVHSRPPKLRKSRCHPGRPERTAEAIPTPYPWATTRLVTVLSLDDLVVCGISKISGQMECERCWRQREDEYDVQEKFRELACFIRANRNTMKGVAPPLWMKPKLQDCENCGQKDCVKPVISGRRKLINWLFLLLGQFIGLCSRKELKYFCKHTNNPRAETKERVVYVAYSTLCKQLDPSGPL